MAEDISSKLQQIRSIKDSIRTSIINKGGSMDSVSSFNDYPNAIESIPSGITPSGTLNITADGTYDVSNYSSVKVAVKQMVKVTVTITYHNDLTSTYRDYGYAYSGSDATSTIFQINGTQLIGNTVESLSSNTSFSLNVPANSTVSWNANPFVIRDPSSPTVIASKCRKITLWYVNGTRTNNTSGSFTVGTGDYAVVFAAAYASNL